MAGRQICAGYYRQYEGKVVYVVSLVTDADTGEETVIWTAYPFTDVLRYYTSYAYAKDLCEPIFGGFAPNSRTAEVLSKALGSRTVLSGSVSRGKESASKSLQMMERALLTPDELKSLPKGTFIVMKTSIHPMRTQLRLFLEWGITFGEAYETPDRGRRPVYYADCRELEWAIEARYGLRPGGQVRIGGYELFSDNLCRGIALPGGGSVHVPAGPLQWRRDLLAVYRYHFPGAAALPQHRAAGVE